MWIWLIVAMIAAIGEVLTMDLFLACVAAAALVVAVVAIVAPTTLQVLLFCVLALLFIVIGRPMVKRALDIRGADRYSGSVQQNHIVGHRAVSTDAIDQHGGQIRIGQGEFWTARAFNSEDVIPIGTPVKVLLVDGITALVAPIDSLDSLDIPVDMQSTKGT